MLPRTPLLSLIRLLSPQSDKAAFDSVVSAPGWSLPAEGQTVVIKVTAASSAAAPAHGQRTELPPMEALAKLSTAA
jgi:hypothetical protein